MNNQNISFKSNIRFVDRYFFTVKKKGDYIGFTHNVPNILKSKEFHSEDIRTCTGGGLVIPFKEAEGFHLWDDMTNKKNFQKIINSMFRFVKNPERALILGSKELDNSPFSTEQFKKIKQVFEERIKNVSIFEKHKHTCSETHYYYSLEDDTWLLCSGYKDPKTNKYQFVKSLDNLLECFEKVFVADGDKLFIGKKEITAKEAPFIFKK